MSGKLTQWRLRTMFIIVTALCVCLGRDVRAIGVRRQSLAVVLAAGASVSYGDEGGMSLWTPGVRWFVDQKLLQGIVGIHGDGAAAFTDECLAAIRSLGSLKALSISGFVSDRGMEHIGRMEGLQVLSLDDTCITDEGIRHISSLRKLKHLSLDRTVLTDRGALALQNLTSLARLSLEGTHVSDDSLQAFARMASLWSLNLNETLVTDAGLERLRSCTSLQELSLKGTRVTGLGLLTLVELPLLRNVYMDDLPMKDLDRFRRLRPDVAVRSVYLCRE